MRSFCSTEESYRLHRVLYLFYKWSVLTQAYITGTEANSNIPSHIAEGKELKILLNQTTLNGSKMNCWAMISSVNTLIPTLLSFLHVSLMLEKKVRWIRGLLLQQIRPTASRYKPK